MGEILKKIRDECAGRMPELIAVVIVVFIFGALLSVYALWYSKTIGATNAEIAQFDSRIDSFSQKIDKSGYIGKEEAEEAVEKAVAEYISRPVERSVLILRDDGTDAADEEIKKAAGLPGDEALCDLISSALSKKLAAGRLENAITKALSEANAAPDDPDAVKQAVSKALKDAGVDYTEAQISDAVDGFLSQN